MTEIKLYNTATRRKERFAPIDPDNVRMYVCGPTVYDRAHLGNARPVVVFDVLYRLLRHVYGENHVTYVRNITDVDDKIIARARESGREIGAITQETTRWYHDDMAALGNLDPSDTPHATDYIGAMVAMIAELVKGGHAYEAEGHVLFRVRSYADYGKLSGRSVDDMIAGARVEVAPYKEDPLDFVLWKPSSDDQPGWDSPWGRGRPGWHIECSAMSHELLGDTFDIHGGGNDLQFPHHENEIAQSVCAHPGAGFARYWLHNEMLQVEGRKMSKSLGNFFTVHDLLEGHDGQPPVPGEVIRFVFLGTHYRKPMDWTEKKRAEAEDKLREYHELIAKYSAPERAGELEPSNALIEALANDLNTHGALTVVAATAKEAQFRQNSDWKPATQLRVDLAFLGLLDEGEANQSWSYWVQSSDAALRRLGHKLYDLRAAAMRTKDFSQVDALKSALIAAGVEVRMSKEGVELLPGAGFDPNKLEALL